MESILAKRMELMTEKMKGEGKVATRKKEAIKNQEATAGGDCFPPWEATAGDGFPPWEAMAGDGLPPLVAMAGDGLPPLVASVHEEASVHEAASVHEEASVHEAAMAGDGVSPRVATNDKEEITTLFNNFWDSLG